MESLLLRELVLVTASQPVAKSVLVAPPETEAEEGKSLEPDPDVDLEQEQDLTSDLLTASRAGTSVEVTRYGCSVHADPL